jgi:hypothetical protein
MKNEKRKRPLLVVPTLDHVDGWRPQSAVPIDDVSSDDEPHKRARSLVVDTVTGDSGDSASEASDVLGADLSSLIDEGDWDVFDLDGSLF